VTVAWDGNWIDASIPSDRSDLALRFVGATDMDGVALENPAGSWNQFQFRKGDFMAKKDGVMTADVKPAKVTLAVVPSVRTTFYVQPRLLTK
jgi:hypothetical protein